MKPAALRLHGNKRSSGLKSSVCRRRRSATASTPGIQIVHYYSRNIGTGGYVYYIHALIVKVGELTIMKLRLRYSFRYSQTATPSITATGLKVISGAGR